MKYMVEQLDAITTIGLRIFYRIGVFHKESGRAFMGNWIDAGQCNNGHNEILARARVLEISERLKCEIKKIKSDKETARELEQNFGI